MQVRGAYREFAPSLALAGLAECVWSFTPREAVAAHVVLPDGCVDAVFSAQGGLRVVGTMTTRQCFAISSQDAFVGIRFLPGIAHTIFGLPISNLTDQQAPLEDFWGRQARCLCEQLANTPSTSARISVLSKGLRRPGCARNPVQLAIDFLVAADGAVGLDAVARQANLSPRQFRRRCLDATGLTPKQLCRVFRFRRALHLLGRREHSLAEMATECGYYDQAHLTWDFREFSGYPPAAFASLAA